MQIIFIKSDEVAREVINWPFGAAVPRIGEQVEFGEERWIVRMVRWSEFEVQVFLEGWHDPPLRAGRSR